MRGGVRTSTPEVPYFTVTSSGTNTDAGVVFPLLLFGIPTIVGIALYVWHRRRAYETYAEDIPGSTPAIEFEVSLDALKSDPRGMADKLRPCAAAVSTFHSGEGRAVSRILDTNSVEHVLQEGPTDDVEANAKWAAELLGVELVVNP